MTTQIPESVRSLFWDTDAAGLSLDTDRDAILGRVLEAGGLDETRWLRRTIGDASIRAHLHQRSGRGMAPARLRYWQVMLDLPAEDVDRWVEAARSGVWGRRAER